MKSKKKENNVSNKNIGLRIDLGCNDNIILKRKKTKHICLCLFYLLLNLFY